MDPQINTLTLRSVKARAKTDTTQTYTNLWDHMVVSHAKLMPDTMVTVLRVEFPRLPERRG